MGNFLRRVFPYFVAVGVIALAALLRAYVMAPLLGGRGPFALFTIAVLIAAYVGGFWPGLVATLLGVLVGHLFFVVSEDALTPLGLTILGVYCVNGIMISLVCESLRRSQWKAETDRALVEDGQRQLTAAEVRQREILNSIPHLVWTSDEHGELTYVNERWRNQLGVDLEQTHNGGWHGLVFEGDLMGLIEQWSEAQQKGIPLSREFRIKIKDGTFRWHLVHLDPSKDEGGKVTGWFGTATDVDETHRVGDFVRNNEERFRNLADSVPILIWMSDATKAYTWFNHSWLEFTGRTMEQEVGTGWSSGVHPEDFDRCLEIYHSNFDARQPFEMDYRLRNREGQYRWVIDRGLPLFGLDDVFFGYIGSCIDINERKMAEEHSEALLRVEQSARAEAERTALLKDEFLATVSHEMRTPLTAMLGWVQLLRSGSLPAETVPQALETIERNARAQAKLIDDLLDMSRILSGRLRLDVQSVNILETVEAALAAAEPGAVAKKINLTRVLDSRTGPVSGDPTRLQQVIWNLLNNAIKFTPAGGRITVTLERVDSHLEIAISDTGEGILPEFLPYVFDRFRQQDASTARQHQGLGLGLSIVKQLVELHGGTVRAKSPGLGQGATFVVALPIAAAHSERREKEAPLRPESKPAEEAIPTLLGVKVVVVDDDADARELLRSILAQNGASVRLASSADEALALFQARHPDVLVSDIGMPGKDGYELIRQIRLLDREKGGHTPALALTAFVRSDDRRRAIQAGFHMHLAKPVEPAELVTVVASLATR